MEVTIHALLGGRSILCSLPTVILTIGEVQQSAMTQSLQSKRVAMLVENGFTQERAAEPRKC